MQAEVPGEEAPSKTKGLRLVKRKLFLLQLPLPSLLLPSLYSKEMRPPYWKTRDGKYEDRSYVLSMTVERLGGGCVPVPGAWVGHTSVLAWPPQTIILCHEMTKSLFYEATISQDLRYLVPNTFPNDIRERSNLVPVDSIVNVLANNRTSVIVVCLLSFNLLLGKTGNCPRPPSSLSCSQDTIIYVRTL